MWDSKAYVMHLSERKWRLINESLLGQIYSVPVLSIKLNCKRMPASWTYSRLQITKVIWTFSRHLLQVCYREFSPHDEQYECDFMEYHYDVYKHSIFSHELHNNGYLQLVRHTTNVILSLLINCACCEMVRLLSF